MYLFFIDQSVHVRETSDTIDASSPIRDGGLRMPINTKLLSAILFAIFVFASGCSSDSNNPVLPGTSNTTPVISQFEQDGVITGQGFIGVWDVIADPVNLTVESAMPRALSGLGDTFYVDLTWFLTGSPCVDCLKINSIALDSDQNIVLGVGVKHPFQPGARLDLHVFDLRLMAVWHNPDDLTTFEYIRADVEGDGFGDDPVSGYSDFLVNADGYTTLFDTVIEPALGVSYPGNLAPYVNIFFDPTKGNYDPTQNPDNGFIDVSNPTGQNVFAMGAELENFDLVFSSQNEMFEFTLALDCAYGQSSIRTSRQNPKYFLPEFHRKEAYWIDYEITANGLNAGDTNSNAQIVVSVADWQAGLEPEPSFDPATSPLDSIRHKSDVQSVEIQVFGLFPWIAMTSPSSGEGSLYDPYRFNMTMQNSNAAPEGTYTGVIAVRDSISNIAPGGNNKPPTGVENDGLTTHTLRDFKTYLMFTIDVNTITTDPPVAIISVPDTDITVASGTLVDFDGSTSTPDNLPLPNYEWDFNYDDVTPLFTMDASGKTSSYRFINTSDADKTFIVALRVTDLVLREDIDTVQITVTPASWSDPVRLTFSETQDDTVSLCGDAIAVDSTGKVHVIYSEMGIVPDPPNVFRIKYVTYDGTTVSSSQTISGPTFFTTPMFGSPQPYPQLPGPSLAIDSNDELHAVWTDSAGIRYAHTDSGVWNTAISTFNPDENPDIVPTIAVNPSDNIMIVWVTRRYNPLNSAKPMPKLFYAYDSGSGMTSDEITPFNTIFGGEPYLSELCDHAFVLTYLDDNLDTPPIENDFLIARFEGSWETPMPVPVSSTPALRGYVSARAGSEDINLGWASVISANINLHFKHYESPVEWSDDMLAYDEPLPLSLPSPIRLETMSDGTVFMMWSDTISGKERNLWLAFNEDDDEVTILESTMAEIDSANPVGERQINSTTRDGAVHAIWQDLRNSNPPGDSIQEIYYAKYM